MDATYRLITRAQFECPDGTTDMIERWGKVGYMRFCKRGNVNDGPWMAWEAQYKKIERIQGRENTWIMDGMEQRWGQIQNY